MATNNMKDKEEIVLEDVEKIESDYESLRKLGKYTDVLNNKEGFDVKLENGGDVITIRPQSFLKLCSLCEYVPEEHVTFTLYIIEEENIDGDSNYSRTKGSERGDNKKKYPKSIRSGRGDRYRIDTESGDNNSNKGKTSLRSKGRPHKMSKNSEGLGGISENPDNNLVVNDGNWEDNNSKRNKLNGRNENANDKYSGPVVIPDLAKHSICEDLRNDGYLIARNPELFKKLWKNLYRLLLIPAALIIVGLGFFMSNFMYIFAVLEMFNYLIVYLLLGTCFYGNSKILSKKPVDFSKESVSLVTLALLSIFVVLASKIPLLSGMAFIFLNSLFLPLLILYSFIVVMSIILICFNKKMMDFYREYHRRLEEGTLLVDIE